MGNIPSINRSLTLVPFTRYGPRHVVGSLIIPPPSLCVISHFLVLRDFYPVPISSPPCSLVHARGAPLESVVSLPLSSRFVKLAEDLPMILVVYIFQPGSYPTFFYISVVSSLFPGQCMHHQCHLYCSFLGSYSASASCPADVFYNESVTTPDWRWRLNEFTSVLDYLHPHQMSEEEVRKAKAARAKAYVRTLPNKLKLPLFLTIADPNSSRRGNKPQSQTRALRHRGRSPRCRKTPLLQIHPRPKSVKPTTRRTCKSHLFRNSAAEAYSHLTRVPKI